MWAAAQKDYLTRFAIAALVWFAVAGGVSAQSAGPAYRIIVHPSNQAASVTRRFLAEAFLKKTTRWPDGEAIRPVDLEPSSATRARFTEEVLARSVGAVKSYWQQLIFAGRDLPPPELESDAAVVRYVLRNSGAVGYISGDAGATTNLGGARVLPIK
jgi:ABC-type phosphate transport system substrate-binding protein